ncbi:MAG TPA: hypothetical protein VER55_01830, partial [Ardenticatenaceae bacterium]|nr:hypothetical protein [Ardenticatenaceae bacterium]
PMERVRVFEKGVAVVEPEGGNIGEYHLRMRDGVMYSPRVEVSEPLKNQGAHFIDCVRTGRRPLSDGRDGLKVVQVMEAIDRSIALKGAPVELGQENGYVYEGLNGHYSIR